MSLRSFFVLGLLTVLAPSCREPERMVEPAFYHWQTKLQLTEAEQHYLRQMNARTLYVKFFDVDWDEAAAQTVPLAVLQASGFSTAGVEIVPTVFITNRAFSHLSPPAVDTLAGRIHRKIFELAGTFAHPPIREIQVDCDWSQSTREGYFQLLSRLRQNLLADSVRLSATIRLHQVRYREQTGVPPVDRGMLMCYNTGEVEAWAEENSILSQSTAEPYLDRLSSYPLPLDLALPIFAWGVLFRDGQMIRLINGLRGEDLRDTSRFALLADRRYEVVQSTFLKGYYLYRGDRLRLESVPPLGLRQITVLLSKRWPSTEFRLAFYHLDTTTIRDYTYQQLDSIKLMMISRR